MKLVNKIIFLIFLIINLDCSFEFEYSKNNYNSNNLTNSTKNWMEDNKFENILSGENVIEQFKVYFT